MTDGSHGGDSDGPRPWRADDPDDLRLAQHVAPTDRPNPAARNPYHLVVLGGGSAGLVTAAAAAGLGARVALVEKSGLGGDCLLTGCVPSKALLASARRARAVRTAGAHGVRMDGAVRVDFGAVMARMRAIRAELAPMDSVQRFAELGVDVFRGHGYFVGRQALQVGAQTLQFSGAVVATGGRALWPSIEGMENARVFTHETVFLLETLPATMLVVGGGPVGCELAQAFASFGAHVVLAESGPRILSGEPADASAMLAAALEADGVEVRTGAPVTRLQADGARTRAWIGTEARPVTFDAVLVAAGRAPVVDGLGLEQAAVEFDRVHGIRVNDFLQSSNPNIWAAGDCAMASRHTHVADATARIVVQNALFPLRRPVSGLVIPTCVWTDPEVASVGLMPAELNARNIPHSSITIPFAEVDRARLDGRALGRVQVWFRDGTDRLLGASVVGEGAGDLIGVLSMAITHRIGLGQFSSTIFPYPSRVEVLRKLGDAWRRRGLSPAASGALTTWFRWKR